MIPESLRLRYYPDPILFETCPEVKDPHEFLRLRAWNLLLFMRDYEGIGLAAPQVGWRARVCVVNVAPEQPAEEDYVLINPKILRASTNLWEAQEGCLSVPGLSGLVPRPEVIIVEYTDDKGLSACLEASGMLARA